MVWVVREDQPIIAVAHLVLAELVRQLLEGGGGELGQLPAQGPRGIGKVNLLSSCQKAEMEDWA